MWDWNGDSKSSAVTFGECGGLVGMMRRRQWWLVPGIALAAVFGYWLAVSTASRKQAAARTDEKISPKWSVVADDSMPKFRAGERVSRHGLDADALMAGALANERVLVFKDRASLERFLERVGDKVRVMGRLDALNALRVGFSDLGDLLAVMDGEGEASLIFPVTIPELPQGEVQPGAVPLGSKLLSWLGVTKDNSNWGKGVSIAILDTGVMSNPAFSSSIRSIDLVPPPKDAADRNGHGTAVASMIIGHDPRTPGVAPASSILSVRIADDGGQSDSFLLAQGITAAVDAGVNLINISMGGFGRSALVENAIKYATERGVLVFAAPGNNGIQQVALPAGYDGVIAPAAVDALGNHLDFSNTGNEIDIAAPGYGINAAWPGEQMTNVSGTSFSTPIVVGVVAAIMTELDLPAAQAWQQVVRNANDGGAAGKDPELGVGMPNIDRILNSGTPGIHDAAVASQRIIPPDAGNPYGQFEILIENRGTEPLVNTGVDISTGGAVTPVNVTYLAPSAVTVVRVPVPRSPADSAAGITLDTRVVLSGGVKDARPANDRRVETYVPSGNP